MEVAKESFKKWASRLQGKIVDNNYMRHDVQVVPALLCAVL